MSDAGIESRLVIWGTDVVVSEAKDKFRKFINEFVDEEAEELADGFDPLLPVYTQRLDEVLRCSLVWFVIVINSRAVPSGGAEGGGGEFTP